MRAYRLCAPPGSGAGSHGRAPAVAGGPPTGAEARGPPVRPPGRLPGSPEAPAATGPGKRECPAMAVLGVPHLPFGSFNLPTPVQKWVAWCSQVQGNVLQVALSDRLHSLIVHGSVHRV